MTKKSPQVNPIVQLTICTLSDEDTEKWEKVKKVNQKDATYLIEVEKKSSADEILQTLVDKATAWDYGVAEADIIRFNDSIGQDAITAKGNKL